MAVVLAAWLLVTIQLARGCAPMLGQELAIAVALIAPWVLVAALSVIVEATIRLQGWVLRRRRLRALRPPRARIIRRTRAQSE